MVGLSLCRDARAQACRQVGGGTVELPQCYSAPGYTTWTLISVADGGRRFFGVYIPDGTSADGHVNSTALPAAALPVLVSMSDNTDVCRPGGQPTTAARYGYAYVCAGMGRSRGDGGWDFGDDGVANDNVPLPCSEEASPREHQYMSAILNVIANDPQLDQNSVYTTGFSLNSMFAGWTTFCSQAWPQTTIKGVWQAGSGLKITGQPPMMPNREGDCRFSDWQRFGTSCVEEAPCLECEYFPVKPIKPAPTDLAIRDCIMTYTDDFLAATAYSMYEQLSESGEHNPVLLAFQAVPGGVGGHSQPLQSSAWMVGCMGIVPHCSGQCESWFGQCMSQGGGGEEGFDRCLTEAHSGTVAGCAARCAPTIQMLSQIQEVQVSTPLARGVTHARVPQNWSTGLPGMVNLSARTFYTWDSLRSL